MEQNKQLKWLQDLGLDTKDNSSTEWICDCPFCGDEDHLYLNSETILFDCKKCNASGNYVQLMGELATNLAEEFQETKLLQLAEDKQLPLEAFRSYNIGWTGTAYTVPDQRVKGVWLFDVEQVKEWLDLKNTTVATDAIVDELLSKF